MRPAPTAKRSTVGGRALAVVPLLASTLSSCGDDGASAADAAATDARSGVDASAPDASGCPKLWTVSIEEGSTASATIEESALLLSASDLESGSAIEVTQSGLSSTDFSVSFGFSMFSAADTGAFAQVAVSEDIASPASFWTAAIGTFPTVGVSAAEQPGGDADIQATTEVSGTFTLAREGTTVTATASTSDATATVSGELDATPLRIGIQLGTNMGPVSGETSVRIDDVSVDTGSGIQSDGFDCDSLLPAS